MYQVAFEVFGMPIHWYGIMTALGFMCAIFTIQKLRKHAEMESNQISDITVLAMIAGVVGARIFYVVQFWDKFKYNLSEIIRIDHGGLVFYGGFICASLLVILYCKKQKLSLIRVIDIFAPGLALGHAFGRIGCFLNGCCYGKVCNLPWGVVYPDGSAPAHKFPEQAIHPVQLYEATGNFAIFALLFFWAIKKFKPGQIAAIYLILYGNLRFFLEFLRGDHSDFFLGFTPSQTIALCLIHIGLILFAVFKRKNKKSETK